MMSQLQFTPSLQPILTLRKAASLIDVTALLLVAAIAVHAQTGETPADTPPTYSVLYTFTGGADGYAPIGANPLAIDREGNVYGTTEAGGNFVETCLPSGICEPVGGAFCPLGCGTVFKVNREGRESVEYAFTGVAGEQYPQSNVIRDEEGNLYGNITNVIYKIRPSGRETDLYQFTGNGDGGPPSGALISDREGNLYGVSSTGGQNECPYYNPSTCGVVFKIDPRGHETVLYAFTGGADGGSPQGELVRDEEGNLYGTTLYGGALNSLACFSNIRGGNGALPIGCGVIFKVDRAGKETVLHQFDAYVDGYDPTGLTRDRDGTLYGTTFFGGSPDQTAQGLSGYGIVYKLDKSGKYTILHNFTGKADGGSPLGPPLPIGKDLYGTASAGGKLDDDPNGGSAPFFGRSGVIYKLDQSGKETVLYTFQGEADGAAPESELTQDEDGNLYGTAFYGGSFEGESCESSGCGVVYKLTLHNKCDDDRHHDGWSDPFSNHDDHEK
ncbi:choice-of-anchor tandem repeat GloVer-containing protein [Acidicapsa dinghuensis]|uniref:Choice-of-anchor tandem repeat GloVer-containing protein n=1 Tax=Acidicapsa dinghuensis TaxID=2218256 RepID=A0ABW1EKK2_9BACT|nr:choice-of-anchor tandem repeat GloVer-containing protein [Acidicapsa dinghuensis]